VRTTASVGSVKGVEGDRPNRELISILREFMESERCELSLGCAVRRLVPNGYSPCKAAVLLARRIVQLIGRCQLTCCETAGWGRVSEGPIYSAAMSPLLRPIQMLLLMFAGWVNRHQLDVIEYLQEENRVLKEPIAKVSSRRPPSR
jgi:hypothetical protein